MSRISRRGSLFGVAALSVALLLPSLSPGGTSTPQAAQKVTVTMTEFKFVLRPKTVTRGVVVFTVVNRGKVAHDFKIAGKRTPNVRPGKKATLRVTFAKAGRYRYSCTVPAHAPAGMKGVLVVT
jgi:uncharacterized cupredoxin-like copper-binding protein